MSKATSLRLGIAAVAALLLLVAGFTAAYADDGTGVISGRVENKTQGSAGPVQGLVVTLHTIAHQAQGSTVTTTTDKDGNYRFDKLVTANNYAYSVSLTYKGVDYGSDLLVFQNGETSKSADIAVYEKADSPSAIVIDRVHIILSTDSETQQTLPVMEILILNNQSDRVYAPTDPQTATLRISLPEGAQNVQLAPEVADSVVEIPGGFAFTKPVLPGTNELLYSYEISYKGSSYDLSRSFQYPVQQVSFMIPAKGIKATSSQLTPQPNRNISGQDYLLLGGANLAAGATFSIHIDGLPSPSPLSFISRLPSWALPAAVGLLLVVVAGVVLLRRRGQDAAEVGDEFGEPAIQDEDDEFADEDEFADDAVEDEESDLEEQTPKKR